MGQILEFGEWILRSTAFFAVNAPPSPPPRPTIIGAIVLIIALIVASLVAWWNWREAHEDLSSDSPEDLLSAFEEAHAEGEIDDEEMWRLRAKLIGLPNPLPASLKKVDEGKREKRPD